MKFIECEHCGNTLLLEEEENIKICNFCQEYMDLEDKTNLELTSELFTENTNLYYPTEISRDIYNNEENEHSYIYNLFIPSLNKIIISTSYAFNPEETICINKDSYQSPIEVRNLDQDLNVIDCTIVTKNKYNFDSIKEIVTNQVDNQINNYENFLDEILIKENEKDELLVIFNYLSILKNWFDYEIFENFQDHLITFETLLKSNYIIFESSGLLKNHFINDKNLRFKDILEKIKKDIDLNLISTDVNIELFETWKHIKEFYTEKNIEEPSKFNNIEETLVNNKKFNNWNSAVMLYYYLTDYIIDGLFLNILYDENDNIHHIWLTVYLKFGKNQGIYLINGMIDGCIDRYDSFENFEDIVINHYNPMLNKELKITYFEIGNIYNENFHSFRNVTNMKEFLSVYRNLKPDNDTINFINEEVLLEQANDFTSKRKKAEDLVLKVINTLDKTGLNSRNYQKMFSKMSDTEFKNYTKRLKTDYDENFFIEVLPNKNEPSFDDIKEALNILNTPMNEYVYYRHDGNKDNPIRTRFKVPVG